MFRIFPVRQQPVKKIALPSYFNMNAIAQPEMEVFKNWRETTGRSASPGETPVFCGSGGRAY